MRPQPSPCWWWIGCHPHAQRHVYNIILSRYLELKLPEDPLLPQVLGATPPQALSGASTLKGAIDHVLQVSLAPVTPPTCPIPCPSALPRLPLEGEGWGPFPHPKLASHRIISQVL